MIKIRENSIAIVYEGLGYSGDECTELVIRNLNTAYVPTICIKTKTGSEEMDFKVEEFIALAEIVKQVKQHAK
jgi:hypothetical protein